MQSNISDEIEREIQVHIDLLADALNEADPLKRVIGLSSNLRYLVCHGKGNGWLLRKYDTKRFLTSDALDENDHALLRTTFGIQGLPQLVFPNVDVRGRKLSLAEIMNTCCFYFRDKNGDTNVLTWDELISLIANKYGGQHSDEVRKEYIYEAQRFLVNGVTAVEFLLDWFASFVLQEVLRIKSFDGKNLLIDSCSYSHNGKIEAIIQLRFNKPEGTPIMSFNDKIPEYIV